MIHPRLATTLVVVLLILALEAACRAGLVSATVLLSPAQMLVASAEVLRSGQYTHAITLTITNVAIAALVSVVGGFVIGVVLHSSTFLRHGFEPFLASYYAVPTFIFYPVFIVLLGVGSAAIIALAVVLSVVAMITATLNGLDKIPPVLIKTGRVLGMSPVKRALLIQLPATTPYLFTGARLAVTYSFIGVIASEFLLSGDGLGYAIAYSYNMFDNQTMYGLMLLIIVLVTVINMALGAMDRRLQSRLRRQ